MADLPVPEPQLVTAQMPQSRVSGADIERSGDAVAQGMQTLSAGLDQFAVPLAEQAGRDAAANAVVTRDPNGNPIVQPPGAAFIVGPAGSAYDHAMAAGLYARGQTTTSLALNAIHLEHQNDPAGFQTASDAYLQNVHATWGNTAVGQSMLANATEMASQHYIRLTDDKAATDVAGAKQAVQTQIDDQKSNLIAIARQGQIGSPQFQDGLGKLNALYSSLGSNPLFHVPQGVLDSELAHANSTFKAEAMIGTLDATVNRQGKAAAQQFLTDKVLNNADLTLSDTERKNLYNFGLNHLEYLSGANKAQIAALRSAVEDTHSKFLAGAPVPDAVLDGFDQAAHANGDDETVLRIASMRSNAAIRGQEGLSPQQSVAQQFPNGMPGGPAPGASGYGATNAPYTRPLNQPGEGYAVSPQQMFGYFKQIGANNNEALMLTSAAGSESSFNPNAIHDKNAAGIPQGFGLWGHNVGRLDLRGQSWQQQAGAALQELRSRPESAMVNVAQTPDDLAVAEMHYERPRGYTDANPRGGDNFTGRMNTIRYFSQMAGGGPMGGPTVPTAPGTVPFTAAQIAANPFLASDWVTTQAHDQAAREQMAEKLGTSIEQGQKLGLQPSDPGSTAYFQIAASNPAKFGEQAQRIAAGISGSGIAEQAINLPPGQAQAAVDRLQQAASQRGDVLTAMAADVAQKRLAAHVEALKTDPMGEAVRSKWAQNPPIDLDPANPATFAPAIAQRGIVAQTIASHTGDPEQPILGAADVPAIKALLAQGSTDQKLALLDPWSKLPQAVQQATFRQVGLNDSDAQTFAAAGNVYGHDPQVARDILDGHGLLKQDTRLGPKTADRDAALSASMPATDFEPGLTWTVMNAAQALYAKSSAVAGDTSQVLSQSRWDDAINKVTGGVVDWRGSRVIVPAPGMTDGQFRDVMKGLSQTDLASSRTADGTPLPPSALQPTFFGNSAGYRLQSFGDGRYLVFSGDNAARSYLRTDRLDARDPGGPFVLDLRDRAKAVMAGS